VVGCNWAVCKCSFVLMLALLVRLTLVSSIRLHPKTLLFDFMFPKEHCSPSANLTKSPHPKTKT